MRKYTYFMSLGYDIGVPIKAMIESDKPLETSQDLEKIYKLLTENPDKKQKDFTVLSFEYI